ncbi:MAG: hypothetical protein R3E32_18910 [Chitinophagales bacterium]
MKQSSFSIFNSPFFVLALLLLCANDWVWKDAYSNFLTGKLSDFAGLFVFPLFWAAFFPRFKKQVFVFVACAFIWWKSPCSQVFIEAWNNLGVFPLARIVDYTDLWALLVLPLAYFYRPSSSFKDCLSPSVVKYVRLGMVLVSSFAFLATSVAPKTKQMEIIYNETYQFDCSKEELQNRIFKLYQNYDLNALLETPENIRYGSPHTEMPFDKFREMYLQDTTYLEFQTSYLVPILMLPDWHTHILKVVVDGNEKKSNLQLFFLEEFRTASMNKSKKHYEKKLLKKFEKKVVKKLKRR